MEKLVKLLNEYNGIDTFWIDKYDDSNGNCNFFIYGGDGTECFVNERIISKRFGFIKRLVDNDKIDKKKFEDEFFVCGCCGYKLLSTRETCEACGDEVLDVYEALLMRLAIQDEPIEFLNDMLK